MKSAIQNHGPTRIEKPPAPGPLEPVQPLPGKPGRKLKLKRPRFIDTHQTQMFNSNGHVLFNFNTDARAIKGQPGVFKVAGMRIHLHPLPHDPKAAVEMTMAAVTQLFFLRSKEHIKSVAIKPVLLDFWNCSHCTVTFRHQADNKVIHAEYFPADRSLTLSLPHPRLWRAAGLRWLGIECNSCCARNRDNPTPWLGRSCGCP